MCAHTLSDVCTFIQALYTSKTNTYISTYISYHMDNRDIHSLYTRLYLEISERINFSRRRAGHRPHFFIGDVSQVQEPFSHGILFGPHDVERRIGQTFQTSTKIFNLFQKEAKLTSALYNRKLRRQLGRISPWIHIELEFRFYPWTLCHSHPWWGPGFPQETLGEVSPLWQGKKATFFAYFHRLTLKSSILGPFHPIISIKWETLQLSTTCWKYQFCNKHFLKPALLGALKQWLLNLFRVPNQPVSYAHSPNPSVVINKIWFFFPKFKT